MKILGEFKAFITQGNVMDLAVGFIIGAAFKSVVDALVKDIITPFIGLFGGMPNFSKLDFHGILIGDFLNTVVSFLILAAVVFFLIVKPMNKLMATIYKAAPEPPAPPTPEDVVLLREIRDLLKEA